MKYAITIFVVGFIMVMNTVSYVEAKNGQTVSPATKLNQLSYTNQRQLTK